jgi:hypothetical protein
VQSKQVAEQLSDDEDENKTAKKFHYQHRNTYLMNAKISQVQKANKEGIPGVKVL